MHIRDFWKHLKTPELRLAWIIAMAADAIQIAVMPMFVAGGASPADTVLDVIVAALLIRLLGWHWAFLPTFAAELLPGFEKEAPLDAQCHKEAVYFLTVYPCLGIF